MRFAVSSEWDDFLDDYPDSHLLQTGAWGDFKSRFGWQPEWVVDGSSGAQVLFRQLPLGFTIAYIPKGPVGGITTQLLSTIEAVCRDKNAIVLYIEPDAWEGQFDAEGLTLAGFLKSGLSIQPARTITVSLEGDEEDWLARMKQKTRYNIRLAEKKDVVVKPSSNIDVFNRLMKLTGERNEFGIHNDEYYQIVFEQFSGENMCELLVAYYQDEPLAALMVFFKGNRAWYFYGASGNRERNRMPTYLLQFEAMRRAKARGCEEYDLWGIPDFPEDVLEKNFTSRNDGLWSVYRFKRGFGGEVRKSAGVFQKVYRSILFNLYKMAYRIRKRELA